MISRKEFLALVLPPLNEGENYCTFGIKTVNDKEIVKQRFVNSIEEISTQADAMVVDESNAFFALASYGDPKDGRTTKNALFLKSFYIDLDCGSGKPFADLATGLVALRNFCKTTKMPRPTIVKSGLGAHVYWVLDKALPRTEWKPYADRLKDMCVEQKFDVDPAVTGEAARVLRVPETFHVKDPTNPILVEVLHAAATVTLEDIQKIIIVVEDPLKVLDNADFKRPMDAAMIALLGNSQSRFKTIMLKSVQGEGCNQLLNIYDNQATVDEPLWRAGLSIAQQCVDRAKAIHLISHKHPEYSAYETDRKANETKGPYTCATFRRLNAEGCANCTLKISSPIQIGKEIVEATEAESTVMDLEPLTKELKTFIIPKYPYPFFRGKTGGIYQRTKDKEDNDVEVLVYPYDFYVVKRMQDPDLGETLLLRLHLPKDGVREFIMPLTSVLSKERFVNTIGSFGITALGKLQDSLMYYVTKWVEELQLHSQAEKAHKQFGWIEDESGIIIGDREVRATETVYSPPSSATLPLVPLFQVKGDFHVWKDIINAYARQNMEALAFAFFMGFGTMLMKFTNLDGFLLNLVSRESGSGKTTILQAINSIYGRPKELLLAPKDTYNSRMSRLGVMQSFCVTMDEITNMSPELMSQQAYDVVSGRAKNRLKQHDNAERNNHTKWQTGMVTSSNRYIVDALLSIKGFPDGELKRIMEINILPDPFDDATWARQHFGRFASNYGHAIEPFSKVLVAQAPMVREKLDQMQLRVEMAAGIKNSERYWALMVSLAITGGAIAKQLGLHDIPIKPVFEYGIGLIKETRVRNREYMFDNDEFLGGFLQRHFHEILVINGLKDSRSGLEYGPIKEPRGALTARYEPDTKMLYVVVRSYRDDCAKTMTNFEETMIPYRKCGALIGIKKKRMTSGTVANTQAPVNALCFDTTKLEFFNETVLLDTNANTNDSTSS
jgi:hypothetical protein